MASPAQLKVTGLSLLVSFFAVLAVIFMPIFPGPAAQKVNGLDFLDNFFNQLAKSSAYYIDEQMAKAKQYDGRQFTSTLKLKSANEATAVARLFAASQIAATVEGEKITVSGDFGALTAIMLKDSELMYQNDGNALRAKYGVDERQALLSWHRALDAMEQDMSKAGQAEQAAFVKNCMTKAIEPAYNFYQIEAKPVREAIVLLTAALAFYVVYTMWYGFGLLFLFEGLGIKIDH